MSGLIAAAGRERWTYSSTAGHGTQQAAVDLDDLLDRLTGNPVTGSRSRICSDDDAALVAEGEGGGAVGDLDGTLRVGVVVGHGAQPL